MRRSTHTAIPRQIRSAYSRPSSTTLRRHIRPRFLSPRAGFAVWLSNDPIGISGGLNQYVFCANNPVNYIDPLGLDTVLIYGSELTGKEQTLAVGMGSTYFDHTLLANDPSDALRLIKELTAGGVQIDALIIVDHGVPGIQTLGDSAFVIGQGDTLREIGNAMDKNGHIELWGCNVAEGEEGEAYLNNLAKLFGRPVIGWSGTTTISPFPFWHHGNSGHPYTGRP